MEFAKQQFNYTYYQKIIDYWNNKATKLSMKYGVHIIVKYEFDSVNGLYKSIHFEVNNYKFDNLIQLKTALKNKAFL